MAHQSPQDGLTSEPEADANMVDGALRIVVIICSAMLDSAMTAVRTSASAPCRAICSLYCCCCRCDEKPGAGAAIPLCSPMVTAPFGVAICCCTGAGPMAMPGGDDDP